MVQDYQCEDCGKHLSYHSIHRHKKKSCPKNNTVQSTKTLIAKNDPVGVNSSSVHVGSGSGHQSEYEKIRNIFAPSSDEEEEREMPRKKRKSSIPNDMLISRMSKKSKVLPSPTDESDESEDEEDERPANQEDVAEDTSEDGEDESSSESEEEDIVQGRISDTLEDLIRHEQREIEELLLEFEQDSYYEKELERLRKMVRVWIKKQISGEDAELKEIKKLLVSLEKSSIPRSKLVRMEMILNDISRNRNRVERIIYQLYPVFSRGNTKEGDRRMKALKQLLIHKLISLEQYNNLEKKIQNLDMETIIAEIKETKIGRGLNYLPTTIRKFKENVGQ